jgi:fused signal recognition particle receptor
MTSWNAAAANQPKANGGNRTTTNFGIKENKVDPKTKKIVFAALGSVVAMWALLVGWIGTGYLLDLRYEQQVKRQQSEEAERSYKRAEQERKERIADLKERDRLAAKWKREHPDGRAKSIEDLKGAGLDDTMRNSNLMFPPPTPAEMASSAERQAQAAEANRAMAKAHEERRQAAAEQHRQWIADRERQNAERAEQFRLKNEAWKIKHAEEQKERMAKLLAEDTAKRQAERPAGREDVLVSK